MDLDAVLVLWTAAERDADRVTLDGLLTEDFLAVGPLGFLLTKADWLGRHASGDLRYTSFDLDEMTVRTHGDTVIVTARHTAQGTYRGNPIPEALRASLILVGVGQTWQLAGVHLSFMAGTPGSPPLPGPPHDGGR